MDIIHLHDLRVDTVIGVWDWERQIRQTLIFNVQLGTDIRAAAASDDVVDTVDYAAVSDRIVEYARESGFKLIEALAEGVARVILDEFDVRWVKLRIDKQGVVRLARSVAVEIERGTAA